MIGLRFQNGQPATMARGKYNTRNNRLAVVDGWHTEEVVDASSGARSTRTIWDGNLYNADQVTVTSRAKWNELGHFNLHVDSVSSEFDLCTVILQEPEPPSAIPEPVTLMNIPAEVLGDQILCAALVAKLSEYAQLPDEKPIDTLERLIAERDAAQSKVAQLLSTSVS